ncbi:hypothetical protein F5Y16DRAFT_370176 [Xylariaceae sp. FL0255]|nr:hypothetical protein F5Y16DRAFT_370176 [Xylariaceae sp. FL0255]
MSVPPEFIAVPVVIGVLFIASCAFNIYRRRHVVRYTAVSRQGLEDEYQRQLSLLDARLRAEVEKRKAEEEDKCKGKRIWFSRYVHNGRFKHWVLIVEDTKYELRRDEDGGNYKANVATWNIDLEKRAMAIAEKKKPDLDGYYIYLIGWTQKQPDQLKAICDNVMEEFGKYNIIFNNCQRFLKSFADRIISEEALDWPWFRENTKTEYQEAQAVKIATPEEIVAANKAANNAARSQHTNHMRHHHAHHGDHNQQMLNNQILMQNQINLQNQLNLQNQIQMQTLHHHYAHHHR